MEHATVATVIAAVAGSTGTIIAAIATIIAALASLVKAVAALLHEVTAWRKSDPIRRDGKSPATSLAVSRSKKGGKRERDRVQPNCDHVAREPAPSTSLDTVPP